MQETKQVVGSDGKEFTTTLFLKREKRQKSDGENS